MPILETVAPWFMANLILFIIVIASEGFTDEFLFRMSKKHFFVGPVVIAWTIITFSSILITTILSILFFIGITL